MENRHPKNWTPPGTNRQRGVFTAHQAIAAGMSRAEVRHRLATGRWVRVVGRGLRSADERPDRLARVLAAALTWPDGVICWQSAAFVHHLPVPDGDPVHVRVPDSRRPQRGLVAHRFPLAPEDVLDLGMFRTATRERAIIDSLAHLPARAADSLMAWVTTRDLIDRARLDEHLIRNPRAGGNTQLRRILRETRDGALSAAERLLHDLLRRAGITGWEGDRRIYLGGRIIARADVLFAEARLVVEVDGRAYHGFQDDRTRQNNIVLAGYTILHFTWDDLTRRPAYVIAQIRAALGTR